MSDPKLSAVVDQLIEKHECFTLGLEQVVIHVNGVEHVVLLPKSLPALDVRHASMSGGLLVIVGRTHTSSTAALVIATRREDGRWETKVWHELFVWTLDALGLGEKGGAA